MLRIHVYDVIACPCGICKWFLFSVRIPTTLHVVGISRCSTSEEDLGIPPKGIAVG